MTRLDLTFGRNANGQLTGVTDNISSRRGATFTYTDAGRLETANGTWGDDAFTHDAAGNRTDKSRTIGMTTTKETPVVASASNRVEETKDAAAATLRTLTWRTGGDLSQAAFAGGPTYDYEYNARKRLTRLRLNGATSADYGYDFRGLRVWRLLIGSPNKRGHYVFDPDGRLLAEHDGDTGAVIREYVWLDDMPAGGDRHGRRDLVDVVHPHGPARRAAGDDRPHQGQGVRRLRGACLPPEFRPRLAFGQILLAIGLDGRLRAAPEIRSTAPQLAVSDRRTADRIVQAAILRGPYPHPDTLSRTVALAADFSAIKPAMIARRKVDSGAVGLLRKSGFQQLLRFSGAHVSVFVAFGWRDRHAEAAMSLRKTNSACGTWPEATRTPA